MFENFPYTDMHQLNLDWIIKIAKDFLDQYTHIQQLITEGEQSLQTITSDGVQQLQDKADALEALLQEWYNTHSQDIANQLATALQDLNAWYTQHSSDIDNQLSSAITSLNQQLLADIATFQNEATARANAAIESIPSDYTALYNQVQSDKENTIYGYLDTFEHTGVTWDQQGVESDGTIINLTNWASLYKNTPVHIETPFVFECTTPNDEYSFRVVEYEKIGTNYVWKQGRRIRARDRRVCFYPGYYKFGFQDGTWTYDFYNMTGSARDAIIDSFYHIYLSPVSADRFAEIDNSFNQAAKLGYLGQYRLPGQWEQQGIDNAGAIINTNKWASLYKSNTPIFINSNFIFFNNAYNTNFKFHVLKYVKTNDGYVFESGVSVNSKGYIERTPGYYKFSFEDNSWTFDFYNMPSDQRTEFINNLYSLFTGSIYDAGSSRFEKPVVICSFDWYSDSWQKYQIMKVNYGLDAGFCLDNQTTTYNLDSGLTRDQFDEMISHGWDFTLYGGVGGSMSQDNPTLEGWQTAIAGILAQKENMAIFNPVMYNTPANNASDVITQAVKNNGFLMQRAFNSSTGNFLRSPLQFNTGCHYLTNAYLQICKDAVQYAIDNNCGAVFYAHNMSDSSDLSVATFTEFCQFLKGKVDDGLIEVLSPRQYAYKYLSRKAAQNDYEAFIKMSKYLHDN